MGNQVTPYNNLSRGSLITPQGAADRPFRAAMEA
jgi:hypothetical protein